jgi:hypothetical protein
VLDDPPLNLFGREMVGDILAALDETEGLRALLIRAEGDYDDGWHPAPRRLSAGTC